MKKDIKPVVNLWEKEYSSHIQKYTPHNVSQQLKQMAAFFSPGLFYFYVLNFHNLNIEYVDGGTENILGIAPGDFSMETLLQMLPPEELVELEKKETLASSFLLDFLKPGQLPFFKVVYFFRVQDTSGRYHNMLHQATTLKVSETGRVEHVLGIQTDVSHLKFSKNNLISFISLNGGESYFNLDPEESTIFDPKNSNIETGQLQNTLTAREVEVVRLLAKGLNAERMAEELNLSVNTIRTHRRNILQKTGCNNTTESSPGV